MLLLTYKYALFERKTEACQLGAALLGCRGLCGSGKATELPVSVSTANTDTLVSPLYGILLCVAGTSTAEASSPS